ncbi:TIM barrel protein [Candidatus Micrarchaeota archaeon]|nr:TIM barrel protein [Candidatus Micrarchaeota archaeon]
MKKQKVFFGPAGIPLQCKGGILEGVECCNELGFKAMEMEFGMGIWLKEDKTKEVKKLAKKMNVHLSSHAPYWINFCSKEKKKQETSIRNLYLSAKASALAGATITVFHPGYYQKQDSKICLKRTKKLLAEIKEKLDKKKLKIILGAETVGKKSQFGSLKENIEMAQELNFVKPVFDFAHMHAREDWRFRKKDDYLKFFEYVERELPGITKNFHSHFSEINYTEKGERNHLVLGSNNEPPYKPLMKMLAENGYGGRIICETPALEIDAKKMKKEYLKWL